MSNIYQRIWDADQNANGIQALLSTESGTQERGFVKVNTGLDTTDRDFQVLTDVHIPENKKDTYLLGLKLFDNYRIRERDIEIEDQDERTEVHNFVDAIIETPPMQVAREYIAQQTGSSLTRQRWYNTIMEMWFRTYAQNGDPHLSGFEHVIMGEQDGSKAKGYHFWYKYYLDDGYARLQDGKYSDMFPELVDDRIEYLGSRMAEAQKQYPESVTISYKWFAPDYEREATRPLTKPIGGFFVGCSLEGLLAMGTVRAHLGIEAPKKAVINGAEYDMKLYHSNNQRHVRTFYPKFLRAVEEVDGNGGGGNGNGGGNPTLSMTNIKIIAALVNPEGHDPGMESITIINTSKEDAQLNNWIFVDKNDNTSSFSATIKAGDTHRIVLDGQGSQLGNSGGLIKLLNASNEMVHLVSYAQGQVREQGRTIIF